MNVTQMVEEVRSNAHELNETFLTDADIIRYLNRGQRRAQNILSRAYEEFFATVKRIDVTGYQQIYDIPVDCVADRIQNVDILFNNEFYHLDQVAVTRTFNVYYQFSDLVPSHFQIRGNQIILFPTPSVTLPMALIITYTRRVGELGASQGVVSSVTSTAILSSIAVSSVTLPSTFQLPVGADLSNILANDALIVDGSSLNDGEYLVVSSDDTLKTITVAEVIPDVVGPVFGNASVSRDTIIVDNVGDGIVAGKYITVGDPVEATSHGSFLVDSVNTVTKEIVIRPVVSGTTYRNVSISSRTNHTPIPVIAQGPGTFATEQPVSTNVTEEDIITMTPAIPTSSISKDYHDYLVYFATVEVLKKAKEPIDEFLVSLKEASEELENAKSSRLAYETVRITRGFGHYGD